MNRLNALIRTVKSSTAAWDSVFLRGQEMEDDGDGVLSNPYKKSTIAYICISTTGRAIAQAPLVVEERVNGNWKSVNSDDPWQTLFEHPNHLMSSELFTQSIVGHLLLDGNIWIVPFPFTAKVPDSLWVIKKNHMSPTIDPITNQLVGWEYSPSGFADGKIKNSIPLSIEEVAHIKFWNPNDLVMGQAPLEAAKMPLRSDYKAARYNEIFFDEGARPGGVLSTENRLGDKQFKRTKEQFETRHKGFKKSHRIALLEQGLKYDATGLSQKDMEYIDLRKLSRDEVIQCLGMRKSVLGITDNLNYATSREQKKMWWLDTNIPIMKGVASALRHTLFASTPNRRVIYDISTVEALQEDFKGKVDTAVLLSRMGYTANEVNKRLELGFDEKPWRNYWFAPVNLQPIDENAILDEPEIPDEPEDPEPTPTVESEPEEETFEADVKLLEAAKEIHWKRTITSMAPYEKKFTSRVKAVLFRMRKKTLAELSKKSIASALKLNFAEEKTLIKKYSAPLYEEVVKVAGTGLLTEVGINIAFDLRNPAVIEFLQLKPLKVRGVVDTMKDSIRRHIIAGREGGEGAVEIAGRVRSVFTTSAYRAKKIARTEVVGAQNFARQTAMKSAGIKYKEWFTAMDERVRDTHAGMHGKKIPINASWTVGRSKLNYPGDWNGDPDEVINCRCIEVAVIDES